MEQSLHASIPRLVIVLLCAALSASAAAEDGAARALADGMIEAYGGLGRWNAMPSVSFLRLSTRKGESAADEVRVVVEQGRRRTYLEWSDGARITSDGTKIWSTGWTRPTPPSFMVNLDYYFFGLPWFTRDLGVQLSMLESGRLPGQSVVCAKVKMSFDASNRSSDDIYILYIDPETNLLRGVEYTVTHAALIDSAKLPEGSRSLGPFFRIFDAYERVDGLVVPGRARSVTAKGELRATDELREISFRVPFDLLRMTMLAGAKLDESRAR